MFFIFLFRMDIHTELVEIIVFLICSYSWIHVAVFIAYLLRQNQKWHFLLILFLTILSICLICIFWVSMCIVMHLICFPEIYILISIMNNFITMYNSKALTLRHYCIMYQKALSYIWNSRYCCENIILQNILIFVIIKFECF